jgi:hypothetical protein
VETLLNRLLDQIGVIWNAPGPFLLAAVVLTSRLRLRDDEIEAQKRAQGATGASSKPVAPKRKSTKTDPLVATSQAGGSFKPDPMPLSDRTYVPPSVTPLSLMTSYRAQQTGYEADKVVEIYIGKWINLDGKVDDLRGGSSYITLYLETEPIGEGGWYSMALISCSFQGVPDEVTVLRRGDPVRLRGQIVSVGRSVVNLDHCELVQD